MSLGPVQLLVIGFDRADFSGEALAELKLLRDSDVVRVIDLIVVHKGADGVVERVRHSDLDEGDAETGSVIGALIGLDGAGREAADAVAAPAEADGDDVPADEEFWSLDEAIPNDSAAAIALVEHRWAIATRDAIRAAGRVPVADAWIHPADLAAAGLTTDD